MQYAGQAYLPAADWGDVGVCAPAAGGEAGSGGGRFSTGIGHRHTDRL